MATIKTIKYICPYCKQKAKGMFGLPQRKGKHYGCSLRRCHRCKNEYVDSRINEIGLHPKEETYPSWSQFNIGWVVYYITVVAFYVVIAFQMKSISGTSFLVFLGILLGSFVLQIGFNLLTLSWRKRRWQEEHDRSMQYLERRRAAQNSKRK